jgi:hypothetical protein
MASPPMLADVLGGGPVASGPCPLRLRGLDLHRHCRIGNVEDADAGWHFFVMPA